MKKLTKNEKKIERALIKGEYLDVGKAEFEAVAQSLAMRKKDAVLNIRVNREDLENIKRKAKKYGVKYQTLVSEWFHRIAS
jgi:predicted DNA binding CopG/RHH family protein